MVGAKVIPNHHDNNKHNVTQLIAYKIEVPKNLIFLIIMHGNVSESRIVLPMPAFGIAHQHF